MHWDARGDGLDCDERVMQRTRVESCRWGYGQLVLLTSEEHEGFARNHHDEREQHEGAVRDVEPVADGADDGEC